MKVFLDEFTWPEIAERITAGRTTALILLGSTENHGPHAPLGTDTFIAEGIGRRLAPLIDAVALPVLPFGHCPQHRSFAGSITISNRTIATLLGEIAASLRGSGFTDLVFLSGHGGNATAIDLAISEIKEEAGHLNCVHARMLPVQTSAAFRTEVSVQLGQELTELWGAHGGEQETSAVLALRPALVDLSKAPAEPDVSTYLARNRDPAVSAPDHDLSAHAPEGSWGDARPASAEQGEAFLDHMAAVMAARVRPLLRTIRPDAGETT